MMVDFIVATISLLGLLGVVHVPLEVLLAATIVYLYGKLVVPSN